jgi:hypothetical protein
MGPRSIRRLRGKNAHTFTHDERVAAEDAGNVMMPAEEGASLVVVETQFAFEVLIDTLGSPPLLGNPHKLFAAQLPSHMGEGKVRRLRLTFRPLDKKPMVSDVLVPGQSLGASRVGTSK